LSPGSTTGCSTSRRSRPDRRDCHGLAAPAEAQCETYDAGGRLVCAGLIESHIHLDKSRIADRCPLPREGGLTRSRWWRR